MDVAVSGSETLRTAEDELRREDQVGESAPKPAGVPLYVDCDGTLITTDLLWESLLGAVRHSPARLTGLPGWLAAGKARTKAELAAIAQLDLTRMPLHAKVVEAIEAARAEGRPVVLATAADRSLAEDLADHLQLFDGVLASDGTTNLSGRAKLAAIEADARDRQPGVAEPAFDYIGDSRADAPLLARARRGSVVVRSAKAPAFARDAAPITVERPTVRDVVKALRVHQWTKNVFLFVPLALMLWAMTAETIALSLVAFFSFSFVASATYIFNDLLDLKSDRRHPSKRRRPFAAGRIRLPSAVALAAAAFSAGVALALALPFAFQALLALYVVTTLSYSLALKRMLLLDVLTVAGLHTLRILAGGAAVSIEMSFWLLSFSLFFFLSLALTKRYTELLEVGDLAERSRTGRGYRYDDLETLAMAGMSASFASVLVLALYINAPQTLAEVTHPWLMWPICPLILYALMRIWILARRNEMHDDPVWFALTDWRSQLTFGATALVYVVAHYV